LYLRIPGATRMNRRELGVLRELALLRDALARERDVPLKFIIPDDVMSAIVHLRPASRDDLAQLRRLDADQRWDPGLNLHFYWVFVRYNICCGQSSG